MHPSPRNRLDSRQELTRLGRLHPYPAMVADELALALAQEHVPDGSRVLDPFCGSGRLLVASERAALRAGADSNPLACLVSRAKLARPNAAVIRELLAQIPQERKTRALRFKLSRAMPKLELPGRKVDWFAADVAEQLEHITHWINDAQLRKHELLLVAAALSAVVREVSYARQDGWKLHRLNAKDRAATGKCPWQRFEARLRYCLSEIEKQPQPKGASLIFLGDARRLHDSRTPIGRQAPYDIVLTSPPYGDSRSTVQYGAASSLCLAVVRHLHGLEDEFLSGGEIDRDCLGGARSDSRARDALGSIKKYWAGAESNASLVLDFLVDYDSACNSIARSLKIGGKAVLVVGRRSTGGFRLKLDEFTIDRFACRGFAVVSRDERPLANKHLPRLINRFARSQNSALRDRGIVNTMKSESIIVLQRK